MKLFLKMKKHVFIIDDKGYAKARDDFDDNAQAEHSAGQLNKRKGAQSMGSNTNNVKNSNSVIVID